MLTNWAPFFGVGLLITMWVGSGWVGNLKRAVRLLMRTDVDNPGKQVIMPSDVLANFGGLLGTLSGWSRLSPLRRWRRLSAKRRDLARRRRQLRLDGAHPARRRGAVARHRRRRLPIAARLVQPTYAPTHLAWVGAGIGSAGLLVLQALAAYLFGAFSRTSARPCSVPPSC